MVGAMREVRMGPSEVVVDRRPDGTVYVHSPLTLGGYPARVTERLEHWARRTPDHSFMAARIDDGDWRHLSYAQMLDSARRIGGALVARKLSAERPVMILSSGDLEHAQIAFGALHVGIAHAPISPAYSLVSTDFAKLRHLVELTTPGLVYVADGAQFAAAINAVVPADVEVVVGKNPIPGRACTPFEDLLKGDVALADAAAPKVGPDTISKFLFTSGSTGMPKGVINTHGMWCANMEMLATHFAYFRNEPPVLLDWSPWNHTAGGNHDIGICLYNGGTFYLDGGLPTPNGIKTTIRNLKEVSPTWFYNIPRGYDAMIPFLREDAQLRQSFFGNLKVLWYAAASMPQHTWDELQSLARDTIGAELFMATGLGATETSPFAIGGNIGMTGAGVVGLPSVGLELKLVPNAGKLEARVKGPNVTPGYWRQPELTAKAYDEEGYYKLGDALRFFDPEDPSKGLVFDGRVTEDFKLTTGTWVSVGPLKLKLIEHFGGLIKDAVITGLDRDYLGALLIPDPEACASVAPDLPKLPTFAQIAAHEGLRARFAELLTSLAARSTGSSTRIARAMVFETPPSIDAGEITDKGSINQAAVQKNRPEMVLALYAAKPDARVLQPERQTA